MNKSAKIVVGILVCVIALVGVGLGGFLVLDMLGIFNSNNEYKLSKVTNLSYDENTYILSFDAVEEADSYYISINDDDDYFETSENSYFYVAKDPITTFKVQALAEIENEDGSLSLYKSDWSESLTYTIPANEVSYASVNAFVSTMLPSDYKLTKLINISIDDDRLLTNAVFERDRELKVYELSTPCDFTIESLSDVVKDKAPYTRILNKYDIANYDSASSLVKSNSYVGQMEEYRQQGYTFEVISQQVGKTKEDNTNFKIYATYKMTNGTETKYINNTTVVGVTNPSSTEKANYTTRVENPEDRMLYEEYFKVFSGNEINVAKDMEDANVPLIFD